MAKRQINKNLVAYLTVSGVLLAVVVVAIAAMNLAQRDPEAIAEKARVREEAGELQRAVQLYNSAFNADENKDPKYLIEAARVLREMGEINQMFGTLNAAYAARPTDPDVLRSLLDRFWELRSLQLGQGERVLECADNLLDVEPDNLLALVSKSYALMRLRNVDPANEEKAQATLERAIELDASDPHVALVRVERAQYETAMRVREAQSTGDLEQAEQAVAEGRQQVIDVYGPALKAHPENADLRVGLAQAHRDAGDWQRAHEILNAGLAIAPDDADLRFALGTLALAEVRAKLEEMSPEEVLALVREGLDHLDQAVAKEPALYAAYARRADLQRAGWVADGRWEREPAACQKELLDGIDAALRDTAGVRSMRSLFGRTERLNLIAGACDLALQFYHTSSDTAVRDAAQAYARKFMQDAQKEFPEQPMTRLLQGYVALIDDDEMLAIKSFTAAAERAVRLSQLILAKEELVRLYRRRNELGLAMQYTDDVIQNYVDAMQNPPSWLFTNKAEILMSLDRAQEAVDLLEEMAGAYPDDAAFQTALARARAMAGQGEEAVATLQALGDSAPSMLVDQARILAYNEEYGQAEELLRQAIGDEPARLPTAYLLVRVLNAQDKQDAAREFLEQQIAKAETDQTKRVLRSYEVMMVTTDPQQRQEQLLALIAEIPEEFERTSEYFNFWLREQDFEKASSYLNKMESMRPDEPEIARIQFDLAIRTGNCERASEYMVKLSKMDADHVGGATFRGRHELACGSAEKALSEFRAAEREFPQDTAIKLFIARALIQLQPPRVEEALEAAQTAVEYDPRSFAAQKLTYALLEQLGRRQEGIPHLELAAKLNPDDPFIKERAELLDEERDPEAGIARREKLRAENPQDAANLVRLAELYDRTNQPELVRERLEAAVDIDPTNMAVARMGASFFSEQQEREAGEAFLRKHIEALDGTYREIMARLLLGRFYETLGDLDGAMTVLEQARDRVEELGRDGLAEDYEKSRAMVAGEIGEHYRRTQRYAEMIEAYRRQLSMLTAKDPATMSTYQSTRRSIIHGLLALEKYGEAADEIKAYRKDYPKDARGMLAEAELRVAQSELEEALAILTTVLQEDTDNTWALYMRARILIDLGRYSNARDDLLRLKSLVPTGLNLQHRLDLVRVYQLLGKSELAESELREMLPLERADRTVEIRLIDLLTVTNQLDVAKAFLNEQIARYPDEAYWSYRLGNLHMRAGEFSGAAGPFSDAIEKIKTQENDSLRPFLQEVTADWLQALVSGNRSAEATAAYEQLEPELLTARTRTIGAAAYLAQHQRDVAVALLEQAASVAAGQALSDLQLVASRALNMLGYEDALAILERVAQYARGAEMSAAIQCVLAGVLATGPDENAHARAQEIASTVAAQADAPADVRTEALMVKAALQDGSGDLEGAVKTFADVVEIDPQNVRALNNLAYILADRLDRAAEAVPYAEQLHENAGENANILDTVGWVYHKAGRTRQAEAALQDALRIAPDNLAARYHLGVVYADTNQKALAERAFRKVSEDAAAQGNKEYAERAEAALRGL